MKIDSVLRLAKEQRYLEDYKPLRPCDAELQHERCCSVAQQLLETIPETHAGVAHLARRAASFAFDHSGALEANLRRVAGWVSTAGIQLDTLAEIRGWRAITGHLNAASPDDWPGGVSAMVALNSAVEGAERIAAASALSTRRRRRST